MKRTHPYLVKLGSKIKAVRKAKKITVRKLGAMCDMDFSALSRLENGQKNFHILTVKAIADALGVDVKDFI